MPVGGGGLLAGTVLAAQSSDNSPRIIAAEPKGSDDWWQSWRRGRLTPVTIRSTIADGLQISRPGAINFDLARESLADAVVLDDILIARAMKLAFECWHVALEPNGAAALAAVAFHRTPIAHDEKVGVVLSGGNVSLDRFADITMAHA